MRIPIACSAFHNSDRQHETLFPSNFSPLLHIHDSPNARFTFEFIKIHNLCALIYFWFTKGNIRPVFTWWWLVIINVKNFSLFEKNCLHLSVPMELVLMFFVSVPENKLNFILWQSHIQKSMMNGWGRMKHFQNCVSVDVVNDAEPHFYSTGKICGFVPFHRCAPPSHESDGN